MSAQVELWRVSTAEGVFEADLETLKQWIAEGCVLPTDKVSKGNLNWIDAGRAPMLKAAFSGDRVELATAPPAQAPTPSPAQPTGTMRVLLGLTLSLSKRNRWSTPLHQRLQTPRSKRW